MSSSNGWPAVSYWPRASDGTTLRCDCFMPGSSMRASPTHGRRVRRPCRHSCAPHPVRIRRSTRWAPTPRFENCCDAAAVLTMAGESQLRLVSIYPTLLGTYGDGGNLRVLSARGRARDYAVDAVELDAGAPVPDTA